MTVFLCHPVFQKRKTSDFQVDIICSAIYAAATQL